MRRMQFRPANMLYGYRVLSSRVDLQRQNFVWTRGDLHPIPKNSLSLIGWTVAPTIRTVTHLPKLTRLALALLRDQNAGQ